MASNSSKAKAEKAALKADLERQIEAATKAQAEKLDQSKDHLKAQLEMASEKYLTVNGYMQARTTYEQSAFASDGKGMAADDSARKLAKEMSHLASGLAKALDKMDVRELDEKFLDGMLDDNFVSKQASIEDIAKQLLIVGMLQNIGPSIDDIVNFRTMTDAEIARLQEELTSVAGKPKLASVKA